MKFLVFAASHRPESFNRKLAAQAADHVAARGGAVDFAEYGAFDMPLYNDAITKPPAAARFGDRMETADGVIISAPEYNWSYPGSLKNIIDWTSRLTPNSLKGKTALLMSASPSARGGITGLTHLKTPLEALQFFVFPKMFSLGQCQEAFGACERLGGAQESLLYALLEDYILFTRKLRGTDHPP